MILQIRAIRIQLLRLTLLCNLASHVLNHFVLMFLVLTVLFLMEQVFSILIRKRNVHPAILINGELIGTGTCFLSCLTHNSSCQ